MPDTTAATVGIQPVLDRRGSWSGLLRQAQFRERWAVADDVEIAAPGDSGAAAVTRELPHAPAFLLPGARHVYLRVADVGGKPEVTDEVVARVAHVLAPEETGVDRAEHADSEIRMVLDGGREVIGEPEQRGGVECPRLQIEHRAQVAGPESAGVIDHSEKPLRLFGSRAAGLRAREVV